LGHGGYRSLRTGIRIDAVFELLRARSLLGGRTAGNRGDKTQQVGSQMLFHVRTSLLSNKNEYLCTGFIAGLRKEMQLACPFVLKPDNVTDKI
jgi:hypothetical protein